MNDNKQALISLFLNSDDNVCFTISAKELRMFLQEIVRQEIDKDKAVQAERNEVEMLNQAQVCSYLGVSKATVWRWGKIGYLRPTAMIGSHPMYNKSDIEKIKKGVYNDNHLNV